MREVLEIRRNAEYFTPEGLRTLTGLPGEQWNFAILKELLDNALDAVNELPEKEITIEVRTNHLAIYDNGPGIPIDVLDGVFDFDKYVSSKRDFRTPTRGFQGNALKTVIAISFLKDYELFFFNNKHQYQYRINKVKLMAGMVEFEKREHYRPYVEKNGIKVTGINLDPDDVKNVVWAYRLSNPDVSFKLNDEIFEAVTDPVKKTEKTFIHWYDFAGFNQLLQAVARKEPQRTVKDFCLKFSGTQRILSSLDFPYKRLNEFDKNEADIRTLYNNLKGKTQTPKPTILANFLSGKETLLKVYNDTRDFKYKRIIGEYTSNEAVIPYALEGFLLQNREEVSAARIITAVNSSVPYENIPFRWNYSYVKFCGKEYNSGTLKGIIDASGFTDAKGVTLFINFVSPYLVFTDKSKTQIVVENQLKQDIISLTNYLCKDVVKEVERAKRARTTFKRTRVD